MSSVLDTVALSHIEFQPMRSELRRFLTRPSCRDQQRQDQCEGAQISVAVQRQEISKKSRVNLKRVEEHLIEQGTALPQHEKVGLDADEIGDLFE